MELRVWTDGIERVVCGVTDVTTCRDVIVALARTVRRTGRYWLVETYNGHQRRLPASERLHARARSSTVVHFIDHIICREPVRSVTVTAQRCCRG